MVCEMQPLILESIELEHFTVSGFDTGCHASDPELIVSVDRSRDGTFESRAWPVLPCIAAAEIACDRHGNGTFDSTSVLECRRTAKSIADGICAEGRVLVFFTRDEVGRPVVCHVSRSRGEGAS